MFLTYGKLKALVFVILILGNKIVHGNESFSLPPDKTHRVMCQNAVINLHPGQMINEDIMNHPGRQLDIYYEIHDKAANDWLVVCNGLTGKILKNIKLYENK